MNGVGGPRIRRNLRRVLVVAAFSFISPSCGVSESNHSDDWTPNYVDVKYRVDDVDVAAPQFEPLENLGGSFVDAAWYDAENSYMVIMLNGVAYHYCGLDSEIWIALSTATSRGGYFNQEIKGRFDCRVYPVPDYP
jgi:hypothetical protein